MRKAPVVLNRELTIKEAQDHVSVRKEPHGNPGQGPPVPDLFVVDGLGDHPARQNMGESVHDIMVTRGIPWWQLDRISNAARISYNVDPRGQG